MTEDVIKPYPEDHFEPERNDKFKTQPDSDASFRQRLSGPSVLNTIPPALIR
jgi:hypothetical protein